MSTFYTAAEIAAVAVAMAEPDWHLFSTVSRYFEGDFAPGGGNKVLIPVPSAAIARDRDLDDVTTSIVMDSLTETNETATLATHAYSAIGLSEEDLSLNLKDFARQVLSPQMDAIVDRVEKAVADVLNGVAEDTAITYNAASPVKAFTALRRALRARGVDTAAGEQMFAIVGSDVADDLLDSGALDFSQTGSADALRGGKIGNVRGFTVLESGRIGASEIVAYPKHGVYAAIKAPAVPDGASFGKRVTSNGFDLRYLRDYLADKTQDRSIVSTFLGAGVMPAYEITRDYTAKTAAVTEVTGGHVVRVDTAA